MKKKLLSLVLALAMCLALAVPALAAEPSADDKDGIEAPAAVAITNITAQEAPVLDAAGWWIKRVYCGSGAVLSLKDSYIDNETQQKIAVGSAQVYKVDSLEVFYSDPYLCANIEYSEDGQPLEQGSGDFPLKDGEWLVMVEKGDSHWPAECIYVNVGGSPAPAQSERFTDVPADAWYAQAVNWAVEKSVTNGTGADTFSPQNTCTRGEIITFLWRAAGRPVPAWRPGLPQDAGEDEFYSSPVKWAAVTGLFSGNTFAPNAPCTRAMAVEFLWRNAGCPEAASAGQFADVPAGEDLSKAVAWAMEKGITQGTSATEFSPDDVCTRGHIVTFLYRAFAAQQ